MVTLASADEVLAAAEGELREHLERRAYPRRQGGELPWVRGARLKHGPLVTVIDLSAGGVLLEAGIALRPGSQLALEITGSDAQWILPFNVLRCHIASLRREGALYRGACEFARVLDIPGLWKPVQPSTNSNGVVGPDADPGRLPDGTAGPVELPAAASAWQKVVVRYTEGCILKGYTHDFNASRPQFSLWPSITAHSRERVIVPLTRLKAVFFVRHFEGNPQYVEDKKFEQSSHGRRIEVTFLDNEVVVGTTLNYRPDGQGFFLTPADPRANNARLFVVSGAVRHIRFL